MSYPPPPDGEPSESGQPVPGQTPGQPGQPGYGPPGPGQPPPYGYDPNQPAPYGYGPGQPPPGYGPQPYGYAPGQPPYQPGYYPGGPKPEHPGAVPSLVIGVIGLLGGLMCAGLPLVLGPWAWIKGKRTVDEIDASGGQVGGRGLAVGGYVCGIVATVLLALGVLALVIALIVAVAAGTSHTSP